MTAQAALHCHYRDGRHQLTKLRSHGQFVLRPTHPKSFEPWAQGGLDVARVSVSSGTAGPLGGDDLWLDVEVGPGATLVLNEISATLALPGPHGDSSKTTFTVRVAEGGTLIWLPEPVIAARGCDHHQKILVELEESSRFFLREELILGRHNESPGNIQQHLRITRGGAALYDQNLQLGRRYHGWDSPAVAAAAKAVGTMTIIDPGSAIGRKRSDIIGPHVASVGLDDDVVQAMALAENSLILRRALDEAAVRVGGMWSNHTTRVAAELEA